MHFCLMLSTIGRHVDIYQVYFPNLLIFIRLNFLGTSIFFFFRGGANPKSSIFAQMSKQGTNFNQHVLINLKPKLGVHEQTQLTSLYDVITVKNRKEISGSKNFTMLPNCGNVINYGIIISSKLVT